MSVSVDISLIEQHIRFLTRSIRPAESSELEECRQYVAQHFEAADWIVSRTEFTAESDYAEALNGINVHAVRADFDPSAPRFVVGAHLDSRPDSPGADDNASAVATLLEIARLWPALSKDSSPALQLELIAYDLEENGMLGGAFHAATAKKEKINLRGMISLEMLGYCDHSPNSQQLPKQLVGLYPDTGNFIAVIGNQNSTQLIDVCKTGMEKVKGLPVESLQVPQNGELLQATRLSDHSPYWDEGFAALMITDTSFLRNPHYHQMSDTIETLDMQFLELVANGCLQAVADIVRNGI